MNKFFSFKRTIITTSWLWIILFAICPAIMVITISFLNHSTRHLYELPLTLQNYQQIFNTMYLSVFGRSLKYAALCTIICLLISYPFAYHISQTKKWQNVLLMLVIIPFWTSSLIRSYAIMALLKAKGLINTLLIYLGLINEPLQLLYSNPAMMIGLVYTLIPFMILPLYANMTKLDHHLFEAARDLGANRFTILRKILIPLTMPGILSGSLLVFLPAMTLFYIPTLLGGAKSLLLGNVIELQYLNAQNWPLGSATSVMLIVLMLLMLVYYFRHTSSSDRREML
jgi:spermidine/putrescine transport system permease protein